MTKRYNPWLAHRNHRTEILPGSGPHIAKYWCVKCDKFIGWVSKSEYAKSKENK